MTLAKNLEHARRLINDQAAPTSVRRSAWLLYLHELDRINMLTKKPYTHRQALSNTLRWISQQKAKLRMKRLTPLQRQIVHLMAVEGLSQKQIAERISRSPRTIEVRCKQIRMRLGLSSMYQVVALAVQRGWVSAPLVED